MNKHMHIVGVSAALGLGLASSATAAVDGIRTVESQIHNLDLIGNQNQQNGYGPRAGGSGPNVAPMPLPDAPFPGDPEPNVPPPLVPLPPAAWAGAAMLAGIAGVRFLRRRK